VGRTYGNGTRNEIAGAHRGYTFAPNGETTAIGLLHTALAAAQYFVYLEDQYLVDTDVSDALLKVLQQGRVEFVLAVITATELVDSSRSLGSPAVAEMGGQGDYRRYLFLLPCSRSIPTRC
jgi:hypothetical protein